MRSRAAVRAGPDMDAPRYGYQVSFRPCVIVQHGRQLRSLRSVGVRLHAGCLVTDHVVEVTRPMFTPSRSICSPTLTSPCPCRMATDLNLHRRSTSASPDTPEGRARDREVRNRERTWIICFCLDRSFSAQMGKPYSIKEECVIFGCYIWHTDADQAPPLLLIDMLSPPPLLKSSYMIRNASQWARSPGSVPADSALAGYAVRAAADLGPTTVGADGELGIGPTTHLDT